MIEADRADHSRAKLDHDLIVPITRIAWETVIKRTRRKSNSGCPGSCEHTPLCTPAAAEAPTTIYTTTVTDTYSTFNTSTVTYTSVEVSPSDAGCPTTITGFPEPRGVDIPCHPGSAISPRLALQSCTRKWRRNNRMREFHFRSRLDNGNVPLPAKLEHVFHGRRPQITGQVIA